MRLASLVVVGLLAAGCVGANATPSDQPSGPPASTPGPTSSPVPATTAPATEPPTSEPTESSSPAPVDPLQQVPAAPAGVWTSIKWTSLPASTAPGVDPQAELSNFQAFGWSKGFVGFAMLAAPSAEASGEPDPNAPTPDPNAWVYYPPVVLASYSSDGVHWHAGQKLDPLSAGSRDLQTFRRVIEGPGGLLAVGWSGACGSEYLDALWTSSDGISWQPVNVMKAFGADPWSIVNVSGGATGYTAVAYGGAGVWTSSDGRNWKRVATSAAPFKNARVDDATAGAAGFVLAGVTGTRDCGVTTYDGPTPLPPALTPALWTSPDGSSWTRIALPGAVASREVQQMWTSTLGDHALLVVDDVGSARSAWGSSDGKAWKRLDLPRDFWPRQIVNGVGRSLVVAGSDDITVEAPLTLRTFDEGFALRPVAQSGDVPSLSLIGQANYSGYGLLAIGPTGVLVGSGDGKKFWFGVPSAQ